MTLNYKVAVGALVLMLSAASCSDDNDWRPGEPADPDCMIVYFEQLPSYNYTINADDDPVIPVTVSRANYEEAASVPVEIISCPENVDLPPTIEFEAGQKSVVMNIDLNGMASKSTGKIELKLDPAYTSVYAAGTSTLLIDITKTGSWVVLSDRVRIRFSDKYSSSVYVPLYVLEGSNRFKFENFLNSGVDFEFSLGEKQSNNRRYIQPLKNFILASVADDVEDDDGWYFYDDAAGDYPVMYPFANNDLGITDMYCFGGAYSNYNYINIESGSGYLSNTWCVYTDGTSGYQTVRFTFTALFDPFETEE